MSEIQDEAYTELCQENEHLKFLLIEEQITIDQLAKLCLRAADELMQFHGPVYLIHNCCCPVCKLTNELRNAAK